MHLRIGDKLSKIVPAAGGLVGLFVTDEAGATYVVTSARLVPNRPPHRAGPVRSSDLIGRLPVPRGVLEVAPNPKGIVLQQTADPRSALGKRVERILTDLALRGTVYAIWSSVQIIDPDGRAAYSVSGLVEVWFDESLSATALSANNTQAERGAAPSLSGADAGALVVDHNDAPLGILVAGSGYRGFVAPLKDYLKIEKLTIGAGAIVAREESKRAEFSHGIGVLVDDLQNEEQWKISEKAA